MDEGRRRKIAALQGLIDAVPGDARLGEDEPERAGAGDGVRSSRPDGVDAADHPAGPAGARKGSNPRSSRRGRSREDAGAAPSPREAARAAYRRIVELCGYHDFCCAKLRERLRREGFPEAAVEEGLAAAMRVGLVDDLRWGEMRAAALMRRGAGNGRIVRELRENGIDAACIGGWPRELEERYGSEYERAMAQLRRNPPRSRNPRASAYGRLLRKGYGPDVASRACDAWLAETADAARRGV